MKTKHSNLYQFVFDYGHGVRKTCIPKFKGACRRAYQRLSRNLVKKHDYTKLIKLKVGDVNLLFTASHSFPAKYLTQPLYATNLSRLCGFLASRLGCISVIDVGANIGDSAALIASACDSNVLCIEGNEEYYELLTHNSSKLKGVEIELSFVGERDEQRKASIISDGAGTTTLSYSETKNKYKTLNFRTLDSIISDHPSFNQFKVMKIDTDGYDLPILCANIDIIKKANAVIHMEYAPSWMPDGKDSQIPFFEVLSRNQYNRCIVYTSEGDVHSEANFKNIESIKSFHEYFCRNKRYGDIATFSDEDEELYKSFVHLEYKHMREHFCVK